MNPVQWVALAFACSALVVLSSYVIADRQLRRIGLLALLVSIILFCITGAELLLSLHQEALVLLDEHPLVSVGGLGALLIAVVILRTRRLEQKGY